ncbi:MAG: hypothetical protein JWN60_2548 [Acidobacteria bacterium]|jgi:hypothetical protein|nr:hypothetical protein [Acidobacteriota bacterium]
MALLLKRFEILEHNSGFSAEFPVGEFMKEKRCAVCQKRDFGQNEGLEKVGDCRRCGQPVCQRCKCPCTSDEKKD